MLHITITGAILIITLGLPTKITSEKKCNEAWMVSFDLCL